MSEPSKLIEPQLKPGRYFRADGAYWRPASDGAFTREELLAALDQRFPDNQSLINKKIRWAVDLLLGDLGAR